MHLFEISRFNLFVIIKTTHNNHNPFWKLPTTLNLKKNRHRAFKIERTKTKQNSAIVSPVFHHFNSISSSIKTIPPPQKRWKSPKESELKTLETESMTFNSSLWHFNKKAKKLFEASLPKTAQEGEKTEMKIKSDQLRIIEKHLKSEKKTFTFEELRNFTV